MVVKGSAKWEAFLQFLNKVYKSLLYNDYLGKDIIFIFDNARTHHANLLNTLFLERVNKLYLPPYSP